MLRLLPPSLAFKSAVAWKVVPEPPKKSKISDSGSFAPAILKQSATVYNDFGKLKLPELPNMSLSKTDPCSTVE
jgi:hypothetical protein